LQGGLDVQAKKKEPITVAIVVLEYGNTSGQQLEQPVGFKVTMENGVVDTRYLWPGLIGSGILGIIAIRVSDQNRTYANRRRRRYL
jgi:hypothetical protein